MSEIATRRDDLCALKGLHLWHAGLSNCSQRVRLVLEEKGLSWTSHIVDLFRLEHATPEYQSIHPKGLVPTLIHDGRTIIDSNDIITYLDDRFPDPPLRTSDEGPEIERIFALASDNQLCLRTLSHEFMFGEHRRYDHEMLQKFDQNHSNGEFARFLRQFATDGFSEERLLECFHALDAAAAKFDTHLSKHPWLSGGALSLADFCWIPNIHRFDLFGFPMATYPNLLRWFRMMKARPSYQSALTAYESNLPSLSAKERARRETFFRLAASKRQRRG